MISDESDKIWKHQIMLSLGVDNSLPTGRASDLVPDISKLKSLLNAEGRNLNVDACRDRCGTTALGVAAWKGLENATLLLLESGASVHAQNLDGATSLSMAIHGGSAPTLALMLEAVRTVKGQTQLDLPTANAIEEAYADAQAVASVEVLRVFEAWRQRKDNTYLNTARDLIQQNGVLREKGQHPTRPSRRGARKQREAASAAATTDTVETPSPSLCSSSTSSSRGDKMHRDTLTQEWLDQTLERLLFQRLSHLHSEIASLSQRIESLELFLSPQELRDFRDYRDPRNSRTSKHGTPLFGWLRGGRPVERSTNMPMMRHVADGSAPKIIPSAASDSSDSGRGPHVRV